MISQLKGVKGSLVRRMGIYLVSSVLNGLVPFLLMPVLIYYLDPSEYGTIYLVTTLIGVLGLLGPLGIQNILQIYFHQKSEDFKDYLTSSWFYPFLLMVVMLIFTFFNQESIVGWLGVELYWVMAIPFLVFLMFINQTSLMIARNREKPIQFGLVQISGTSINMFGSLLFIAVLAMGVNGRLLGHYAGIVGASFVSIFLVLRKEDLPGRFNLKKSYELMALGAPLIFHNISGWIINKSDTFFVNEYLGKAELGIYSAGYQIGMILMILQAAVADSLQPHFFKTFKSGKNYSDLVRLGWGVLLVLLLCAILVAVFSPLFFKLVNTEFLESAKYVPWIAIGYFCLGGYKIFSMSLFYEKRIWLISSITGSSAVVNLILNYVLIKKLGVIGVAIATTSSMFMMMILTFILAQRIHPLPWFNLKRES